MKSNGLIIGIMLLIAHATLAQQTQDDKYITVNGVSFKMVYVEGGTFTMGCTPEQNTLHRAIGGGCGDNEKPPHSVTLSSYYIGEVEVTQELWKAVMGSNSNPFAYRGDNLPVNDIPYSLLSHFFSKLNQLTNQYFRLPTEAEWEYAARGGKKSRGYMYSGSNSIEQVAWYNRNSEYVPQPVKRKAPNELGIYDMSGNVKELCGDLYGDYSGHSQLNPTGASSGRYYVCRGGDYRDAEWSCRNSCRNSYNKEERSSLLGFRLVMIDNYCKNEANMPQHKADVHATNNNISTQTSSVTIPDGYIDLGLPSGTLWKNQNENGLYAYDDALSFWGDKMATNEQWNELFHNCKWTKKSYGYEVKGPNGNAIFLTADGCRECDDKEGRTGGGYYWTATSTSDDSAIGLFFYYNSLFRNPSKKCNRYSIRLVMTR